MQVAVVYRSMTALVLHHHYSLVSLVGGIDLEVLQCDIVGLIECHHTIVLLMLVVRISTSGVVVVIDLHIALAALTLQCECVDGSHSLDVRNAHLLIILACLNLQCHRTFHSKCADIVDCSLDGGIVTTLSDGIGAALSACHSDRSCCRILYRNGLSVNSDAVERCRCGLSYLSVTLHVVSQPEVVGSRLCDGVTLAEFLVGRECRCRTRLIDMVVLNSLATYTGNVKGCQRSRRQVTLSLYHYLEHLGVGLSLQHFTDTDVFGRHACNYHVGLLVTLYQHGEVRFAPAALADVFDGYLAAIDIGIRDDWIELSRRS